MPPTNEHAVATVFSTHVLSHDEASILVEAGSLTPLRWFLEWASASSDREPPTKRRKTVGIENEEAPSTTDDAGYVPLHSVSIDLHFPETLNTKSPNPTAVSVDVDFTDSQSVQIMGCDIDDDGFRLRLTSSKKQSAVLVVDTNGIPKNAVKALQGITRQRDNTGHLRPAVAFRSTLTRSCGQLYSVVRLQVTLSWRSGHSAFQAGVPVGKARVYEDYEVLAGLYPDHAREEVDHNQRWTPQDFYDSVYVPNVEAGETFNDPLEGELYPFQKRAVKWMLARERADPQNARMDSSFYKEVYDAFGKACYVNYLQGIISRTKPTDSVKVSGGILAEEMGLGKTVELMALMALHPSANSRREKTVDPHSQTPITPSKATLIITPPSILQQWKLELSRHAPLLNVYHYQGIPTGSKRTQAEDDVIRDLSIKYDVVLATYQTLGKEVHYTEDPPERNMRHLPKTERKRSPLVQIQWWRICLDEAQMVESGVTAAARVACRLPRVHSWAVSGTPLRKNVQDLHGLLIFLQYRPLSDNAKLWSHLIANHRHLFRRIFGEIALRHTKAQVREEIRLPPQKRVVITVPFSAVEQQNYSELFAEMCKEVGLNNDGSPMAGDWDPSDHVETMRAWLLRLRQTCLNPQIGSKNRKAFGRTSGPLRTVAQVLEIMIEQNETTIRVEERSVLANQLLEGHILGNNRQDEHRSEKALKIYIAVMERSESLVEEARERLRSAKSTAIEKSGDAVETETDDEHASSESTPLLGSLRNNLRTALQLLHTSVFFAATSAFQIKSNVALTEPDSEEFKKLEQKETDLYESAKTLRREILKGNSQQVENRMRKIKALEQKGALVQMPVIKPLQILGGIENRRIVEKSTLLFDVIRDQSSLISEWRVKMSEFLLKPLVDEDDGMEITGDEYEDSTKQQDELYVYFDAVKAMQADINTSITGETAPLIDHEVKSLLRDAKWALDPDIEFDGVIHAPELILKLLNIRNGLRTRQVAVGSVRGLVQEARMLQTSIEFAGNTRAESERSLVQKHISALQKIFSEFSKALNGLEKEIELFRSTQNQRLEFYRQLQELSDDISPFKEELDDHLDSTALEAVLSATERQAKSLSQLKTKNRFLVHLRHESGSQAPKICVICQSSFENGILTSCGHVYCSECLKYWWSQHRTCPLCKKQLSASTDFHNITYKPAELRTQQEELIQASPTDASSSVPPAIGPSIYSDVDAKLMNEIKSYDLPRSYGTKIDALGRHLHWIREHDPGAKSIVFSQYREFLDVLGTALSVFKIGHARLGRTGAAERFKHDPSVDCLLLDAKTDSSGLTLVNATHVFLCEPLIQTAVELQAIARVHRIGQTRPTTVWLYLVAGSVEEAISDIAARRRLAYVRSRRRAGKSRSATPPAPGLQETALEAANTEEMQAKPLSKLLVGGKGGGEVVDNDDLWQCLFGKAHGEAARPSGEMDGAVGRFLRAEAAEDRRAAAGVPSSSTA